MAATYRILPNSSVPILDDNIEQFSIAELYQNPSRGGFVATTPPEKNIVRSTLDIFLSRRPKVAVPPPIPDPPIVPWKETLMGIEDDIKATREAVEAVALAGTPPIPMEPDHIPCPPEILAMEETSSTPTSTQPGPEGPAPSSLLAKLGEAKSSNSVARLSDIPVKSSIAFSSTQDSIELTFSVPISWIVTHNPTILRTFLSRMLAEKVTISAAPQLGNYLSKGIKSFLLLLTGLDPGSSSDAETGLFGLSPDTPDSQPQKDSNSPQG